ncbi:asparagine synthase (glutamine-hydrolyzing) [Candidatus Nitrospira bockiana]
MCGIAGMATVTPQALDHPERVRELMDRLVHRGPDEEGVYVNSARTVSLGHRRLRIIDLKTGRQPLGNEDGSVTVVFNGEIYGYRALRDRLIARGHRFRTATDTETIVHLYEEEGPGCLSRLTGMFALALWDEAAGRLLLARDRLGKKPLYYAVTPRAVLFASELDALAHMPEISREIDEEALDAYLTLGYIPAPLTIYRAVRKLEAGHRMMIERGRLRTEPYWSLSPTREAPRSREDAQAEFLRRLREATAVRMVSDVPIGCFLSGGVDSSTVLAMMAELSPQPVRTFSIGFPEEQYSELRYAQVAARHFGTDHHEYILEPDGIAVLDRLVQHFGEPFADPSTLPTWYLAEMTRKSVTVALTGDGGDELFAGYQWYRTARWLDRAATLPPRLLNGLAALSRSGGPRLLRRAGKAAALASLPPGLRYATLRQAAAVEVKRTLYEPDFLGRVDGRALGWLAARYDQAPGTDSLNRMMAADLGSYMPEDLLVKVDRMSMAHALECRSPLLDSDLVEWVLALPSTWKLPGPTAWQGDGAGKWLLRAAMRNRFPEGFLDRPKQGFVVPIERWFKGRLLDVIQTRVLDGGLAGFRRFNPVGVRRLVDEHLDGRANHAQTLWALLVLSAWAARYGV